MTILERAIDRRWGVGRHYDCYYFTTPWFVLEIADPDGAMCMNELAFWTGFSIYYRYNFHAKEGDMVWSRRKRVVYSHITVFELERRLALGVFA